MLTWNSVETDFGGETTNFGPRNEGGCSLYQVDTLATISPNEEDASCPCPNMTISSYDKKVCVAVDRFITVFNDGQVKGVVDCGSAIDTLQWSPDCLFVVVGNSSGCVSVLPYAQLIPITLNMSMAKSEEGDRFFKKICITQSDGGYNILCLCADGKMFLIQNVTPQDFFDVQESDSDPLEKLNIVTADSRNVHDDTQDVLFMADHVITMGTGEVIMAAWDATTLAQIKDVLDPAEFCGIVKGRVTSDSSILISLHSTGALTAWDLDSFIMLPFIQATDFHDFELVEGVHTQQQSLRGYRLVTQTRQESTSQLQVFELPNLDLLYSLELHPIVQLGSISPQDTICMLEGSSADDVHYHSINQLRFRCLTESDPERQLYRLLRKHKFQEAEKFAGVYLLDINIVRRAKVKYVLDQLSHCHLPMYDCDVDDLVTQLWACIEQQQFQPDLDILQTATHMAMPQLHQTARILKYAHTKLNGAITDPDSSMDTHLYGQLSTQMTRMRQRLCTYQYLFGDEYYSAESWRDFQLVDLRRRMLQLFDSGDFGSAVEIWRRHRFEWDEVNSLLVNCIISSIPDQVTCTEMCDWLCDDFIPCVIQSTPEDLEKVVSWLERRIIDMKKLKDGWPQNALDFSRKIYEACCSIADNTHDFLPSITKKKARIALDETLKPLKLLIKTHTDLIDLSTNYKFSLTYNQIISETRESIAFRMLDRVVAIQLIETTLKIQIRPYIVAHGLCEDDIFSKYVSDLLKRRGHVVSYMHGAPWEIKATAIIGFITDRRMKLAAISEVVSYAALPWSDEVRAIVNVGLQLDLPEVAKLRETCQWMEVRTILLKYGNRTVKEEFIERAIFYVLKRDEPSSMADALEIVRLKGLASFENKIYTFRTRFLILHDRVNEAMELLRSLTPPHAIRTCKQIISYTHMLLDEPDMFGNSVTKLQFSLACVAIVRLLHKLTDDDVEKVQLLLLQTRMRCIHHIMKDYELCVSLTTYCHPERLKLILTSYTHKSLQPTNGTQRYDSNDRLCTLLEIDSAFLDDLLITVFLQHLNIEATIDICQERYVTHPDPSTGQLFYSVATRLVHVLSQADLPTPHRHSIPHWVYTLASQALTLCDSHLRWPCIELCKISYFGLRCAEKCETGSYVQCFEAGEISEERREWSPVIRVNEDSLVLDSNVVLPLLVDYVTCHITFIESCERGSPLPTGCGSLASLNAAHLQLVEILLDMNHYSLAVDLIVSHKASCLSCYQPLVNSDLVLGDDWVMLDRSSAETEALFKQLLYRQVSCLPIDHISVVCLALSLPKNAALDVVKRSLFLSESNYRLLKEIATIGKQLGQLLKVTNAQSVCQDYEKSAVWGRRLSKYNISYKNVVQNCQLKDKLTILEDLAQCETADLGVVKQFCSSFDEDTDEILLRYLEHHLINCSSTRDQTKRFRQLAKAAQTIQEISSTVGLTKLLLQLHNEVDPYDYEFIEFLLKHLKPLVSEADISNNRLVTQGLQLINSLMYYQRHTPPQDIEILYRHQNDTDEKMDSDLNPLSEHRLPYTILTNDPWKIIRPELNLSRVGVWEPLALILNVNIDHIYKTAIKNCFTPTTASTAHTSWSLHDTDRDTFTAAIDLFSKISSTFEALSYASTIIKSLPAGAAKSLVIKQSIALARKSWEQLPQEDPNAMAYRKAEEEFLSHYRVMATKQTLHQHKLDSPQLYKMCKRPRELLQTLYKHPSIINHDLSPPDINAVSKQISAINDLDLSVIISELIAEWLPPAMESDADLDASTVNFESLRMHRVDGHNDECDAHRFARLMYLLKSDVNTNILFLQDYVYGSSASNEAKLRALHCLLQLAEGSSLHDLLGVTRDDISDDIMVYLYLCDLDKINVHHTPESFRVCHKTALVKGIWSNNRHKKAAVLLVAKLCLDYSIADFTLLNTVIQQLYSYRAMEELEIVLDGLRHFVEPWQLPCLPKVWQGLIEFALSKGESDRHNYKKAVNLLKRCSVVTQINLETLMKKFDQLGLSEGTSLCQSLM